MRTRDLFTRLRLLSVVAFALLCGLSARAELARTLLTLAGGSARGICVLPRCDDAALAVALATNSGFLVQALHSETGALARVRSAAGSHLGRSVFVERGTPGALPLAGDVVDLLVMTDLTDANLGAFATAEVLRVLSPCLGRAILGHAAGAPGTLTPATLDLWLQSFGVCSRVEENADGVWGVVYRDRLAGADDWTHPFHGPDQNPKSDDGAFRLPAQVSWLAKPYQHTWRNVGGHLIADGRAFIAMGANDPWQLQAYNVCNGALLWTRPLSTLTWAQRNISAVAMNGRVFLAQGAQVDVLDAATGTNTTSITFTNVTGQIKWLGISSNVLVALVGTQDVQDSGWLGFRVAMYAARDLLQIGHGELVLAYDLAAGTEKWRQNEGAAIDCRTVAISAGRVFYHAPTARVVGRDLLTGALLWTNATPAAMALLDAKNGTNAWWGSPGAALLEDRVCVLASPDVVFFAKPEGGNFAAFSAGTGALLWSLPRGSGWANGRTFNFVMPTSNLVYVSNVQTSGYYHAKSGAFVASMGASGCGVMMAVANHIVGQVGRVYDYARNKQSEGFPFKLECSMGALAGGGRLVGFTKSCTCRFVRGSMGIAAGQTYAAATGSVEIAEDTDQSLAPLRQDEQDWAAHRANTSRNGASLVTVPTIISNLWTTPARFPGQRWASTQHVAAVVFTMTEAVTVGNRVFVGAADGAVQCLDLWTGAVQWEVRTDGPVLAAPTVALDRVLVTSADGWLYVLEACTGRVLWRYRPGPENAKIAVYGTLQSRWPINTGAHVEGHTAYLGAGLPMQPGALVCAVNVISGQVLWRNADMGPKYDAAAGTYTGTTRVPGGYITTVGNKLWVRSYQSGLGGMAFNATNGAAYADATAADLRGRDIGVVSNRFLLWGGLDVYWDNVERDGKWTYCMSELDANGVPRKPGVALFPTMMTAPAWTDAKMVVASATRLECWHTPAAMSYVSSVITNNPPSWAAIVDRPATTNPTVVAWSLPVTNVHAIAMASNLAVVAVVLNNSTWTTVNGKLQAYDLTTGVLQWEIALPAPPLRNGLTISRTGCVLATLHDGRVACYGLLAPAPQFLHQPLPVATNQGVAATFAAMVGGLAPIAYQWEKQIAGPINNATDAFFTIGNVQLSDVGFYRVLAANPYGAATSDWADLFVVPEPLLAWLALLVLASNRARS